MPPPRNSSSIRQSCSPPGAEQIRSRFAERLLEPKLHARLNHRIVLGDTVIDHETVTRTFPEGSGEIEIAAIYEVKDAKIVGATFITGAMRLFGG